MTRVLPRAVSRVLLRTPFWKFFLSNLYPTPTPLALGFGIPLRYSCCLDESGKLMPAEACAPPQSSTDRQVWKAGRETSQQQAGWTRESVTGAPWIEQASKIDLVAEEGGGHLTKEDGIPWQSLLGERLTRGFSKLQGKPKLWAT